MRIRLASETPEERETRLQQMRIRLASETPEERETRLQQMSERQRQRLAAETVEERETRLRQDRVAHREQRSSVQSKMTNFHRQLATLTFERCSVCSEGFPGLQLHSQSTECQRCSRDKHAPKLLSSTNNMDPGPVPPQLQVIHVCTMKSLLLHYLSHTGFDSGRRDVDFGSAASNVPLPSSSQAVWLQWTCHQPAPRRCLLCSQPTTVTK